MAKRLAALLGILSLSLLLLDRAGADDLRPPNLIYVMVDDLGYGDLGCFGQQKIQTPRLDEMARQGLRLTDYYASNTVCRPSRLSLWMGLHAGHTAISSNAKYVFQPDDVTLPELLQQAGYVTGGVGKWAMGGVGTTGHPNRNGFDFWMGYLDQGEAHNYYPTHLWRNETKVPLLGNVLDPAKAARGRVATKRTTYSHDVMTREMMEFVRTNKDKPFLLHAHWTLPHANNEGGRVTGNGMEIPDYGIYAEKDWPDVEKGQAAMITRLDHDLGRLLDLLKELKLESNTLVVFTSDNGPHSEGGHRHEYFDANGPLRGFKRDLYEGGLRAPTIAWWPGKIAPGQTSDEPLAGYDWLATACELAGVHDVPETDGISFVPTLLGNAKQTSHDYLFWRYGKKMAVRQGKWKAVRIDLAKPVELYDLASDVGESNNVAADHPEIAKKMQGMMADAIKPRTRP